jgi:hypothetical protein
MKKSGTMTGQPPFIEGWDIWLKQYCDVRPTVVPTDCDPSLEVQCRCAVVFLFAIATGSRDPEFLAKETNSTPEFIRAVLEMPVSKKILGLGSALALREAVKDRGFDSDEIRKRSERFEEDVCDILLNGWNLGCA